MGRPRKVSPGVEARTTDALALAQDVMAERAQKSLLAFTLFSKPDYDVNWHHRALCRVLDRFARGEIRRLIVSMPPRHGKSELVSRRLPAYLLGLNPDAQIIAASYAADLAARMNRDVQRIIDSPAYARAFPATRISSKAVRTVGSDINHSYLRNMDLFEIIGRRGTYRCAGVGGGITGMGADFAIIDDPFKNRQEADSKARRELVWGWYTSTLFTRLEKGGKVLLTMTRWHEDDLAGRLLAGKARDEGDDSAEPWTLFEFPAIREDAPGGVVNPHDPRAQGEALWPGKYDLKALRGIRRQVGPREFNALYQQRPAPQEGGLFKRKWMVRRYTTRPARFERVITSWDAAFKDKKDSDYVVGVVLGLAGAQVYVLDLVRDRMGFTATCAAMAALAAKWPEAREHLMEDKANGPAILDAVKAKLPGLIPVEPDGSKEARASATTGYWEAGDVLLPEAAPWLHDFVEEHAVFPNGVNDDQVDAMAQGVRRLLGKPIGSFRKEDSTSSIRPMAPSLTSEVNW
jgi:predicted phage terminase large subunit-like protein